MASAPSATEFKEIPVGLVDDPELPSRSSMDDQKMDELVRSIREIGLQQPIIVHRNGERFNVIAGHRRRMAAERAGLVLVPAIVHATKEAGQIAIQYAENRFREDLNPADEALLFAQLLERDCGGDVDTLAERLGEKRTYIENRLLLLRDGEIFDAVQDGRLKTVGVALELLKVTDPAIRRSYLDSAIRGGATIALVSGWVQDWKQNQRAYSGAAGELQSAAPAGPAPEMNYFVCAVCRETKDVHLMQPINVHTYCRAAILDKLLASYHGES